MLMVGFPGGGNAVLLYLESTHLNKKTITVHQQPTGLDITFIYNLKRIYTLGFNEMVSLLGIFSTLRNFRYNAR